MITMMKIIVICILLHLWLSLYNSIYENNVYNWMVFNFMNMITATLFCNFFVVKWKIWEIKNVYSHQLHLLWIFESCIKHRETLWYQQKKKKNQKSKIALPQAFQRNLIQINWYFFSSLASWKLFEEITS